MTNLPASSGRLGTGLPVSRDGDRVGVAPLKGNREAMLQIILFWAGAILLPLGVAVMIGCWYGTANTPYEYDQLTYLSGGLVGLGVTFVGGFLYFGAWLERIAADGRESSKRLAADGRESSRRLADTLLLLAEVTSRSAAGDDGGHEVGTGPVTAGTGTTIHRRDCSLITHRDDLVPVGATARTDLSRCRVCRPEA